MKLNSETNVHFNPRFILNSHNEEVIRKIHINPSFLRDVSKRKMSLVGEPTERIAKDSIRNAKLRMNSELSQRVKSFPTPKSKTDTCGTKQPSLSNLLATSHSYKNNYVNCFQRNSLNHSNLSYQSDDYMQNLLKNTKRCFPEKNEKVFNYNSALKFIAPEKTHSHANYLTQSSDVCCPSNRSYNKCSLGFYGTSQHKYERLGVSNKPKTIHTLPQLSVSSGSSAIHAGLLKNTQPTSNECVRPGLRTGGGCTVGRSNSERTLQKRKYSLAQDNTIVSLNARYADFHSSQYNKQLVRSCIKSKSRYFVVSNTKLIRHSSKESPGKLEAYKPGIKLTRSDNKANDVLYKQRLARSIVTKYLQNHKWNRMDNILQKGKLSARKPTTSFNTKNIKWNSSYSGLKYKRRKFVSSSMAPKRKYQREHFVHIKGALYRSTGSTLRKEKNPQFSISNNYTNLTSRRRYWNSKNKKFVAEHSLQHSVISLGHSTQVTKRCLLNSGKYRYLSKKSALSSKRSNHCLFYMRFGRCARKDASDCPYIHDPEKVAVCTRFLRGRCNVTNCPFLHKVNPSKMPVCSHFVKASCTRENCPYRHVRVNPDAPLCIDFITGDCPEGEDCKKQHLLVCEEFSETGTCKLGKSCPLTHRRKGMQFRKKTKLVPKGLKKARCVPLLGLSNRDIDADPAHLKDKMPAAKRYFSTFLEKNKGSALSEGSLINNCSLLSLSKEMSQKRERLLKKVDRLVKLYYLDKHGAALEAGGVTPSLASFSRPLLEPESSEYVSVRAAVPSVMPDFIPLTFTK